MLQINNLEGKSDWINESQLLIPMVDNEDISGKEMEGISKHTITLNSLEGADQALMANTGGQTFVIGLDQTLFENYNSKSDLLLMSNSDLKLLPTVSDSKLTYALPSIDHSKSEIVWENNTFEKPLTKDILNVIQETSKGWQEMGKNGDICLDDINSVEVHDSKLNTDFLIEPHMVQSKKLRNDSSDQYIVGYYPVMETCESVLVPASLMTLQQKTVDNEQMEKSVVIGKNVINSSKNLSQLFGNENIQDAQSTKWMKSESSTVIEDNFVDDKMNNEGRVPIPKMNNTQPNSLILPQENIDNLSETVIPLINSASGDFIKAKSKNDMDFKDSGKYMTKDKKFGGKTVENENSALPEQSLPLKKKAKMKKSPLSGNFSFLSGDAARSGQGCKEFHNGSAQEDAVPKASHCYESNKGSEPEQPLSSRWKRKGDGTAYNFKKKKKGQEERQVETGKCNGGGRDSKTEQINRDCIRYNNITEVLEQLRNEKYINEAIFKILRTGLDEMDVDVLQEMYSKRDNVSPDYSSHLKAFALMLHFKQPLAFNRLSELFQSGWPPLSVIKEWKRLLNNRRRPRINKQLKD